MGVDMVPTRGSVGSVFNNALLGYTGGESVEEMSGSVDSLGCPAGPEDEVLEFSQVVEALNVPALSNAVAEAYSTPGQTPTGNRRPLLVGPQAGIGYQVPAQNPIPEDLKDVVAPFASTVQ